MRKHYLYIREEDIRLSFDLEDNTSISNEMTYTEHPTSVGTPITDHAYKQPTKLDMSGKMQNIFMYNSDGYTGRDRISKTHELLLRAMENKYTIDIYTREYNLIGANLTGVTMTYDAGSSNTALISLNFIQLLKANVEYTTVDPYLQKVEPQNGEGNYVVDTKSVDDVLVDRYNVVSTAQGVNTLLQTVFKMGSPATSYISNLTGLNSVLDFISKCLKSLNGKEE